MRLTDRACICCTCGLTSLAASSTGTVASPSRRSIKVGFPKFTDDALKSSTSSTTYRKEKKEMRKLTVFAHYFTHLESQACILAIMKGCLADTIRSSTQHSSLQYKHMTHEQTACSLVVLDLQPGKSRP